jgi:hypothetical protein
VLNVIGKIVVVLCDASPHAPHVRIRRLGHALARLAGLLAELFGGHGYPCNTWPGYISTSIHPASMPIIKPSAAVMT